MKKKKEKKIETPRKNLHKDLQDFDIQLNAFGQIETSIKLEEINAFLNTHLPDRKLNNSNPEDREEE
jgi:hypothetical protein